MRFSRCRLRPWSSSLTILVFSASLYVSVQFLASLSFFTATDSSTLSVWKKTDYRLSLGSRSLSKLDCNITSSESLLQFGRVETVEEALALRPAFRGFQNKTGMLNPIKWRPEYKKLRQNDMSNWRAAVLERQETYCDMAQPPLQYPGCLVHINHAYRFIWIKGKKVGGTTIREPLGWICGDHWMVPKNTSMEFCSQRWHQNRTVSLEEAKKYWNEYFVFGFVRNPYSRYGSSYTYVERGNVNIPNARVSFEEACHQPFLQAFLAGSESWFAHHLHHIMEQSSCFFTKEGSPAVDFVGETEFLYEDLQIVLNEINKRKSPGMPDLEMPEHLRSKNANRHGDYAVQMYSEHPVCLHEVEKHFWMDFQRLGYEYITERVSNRSTTEIQR